LDVAHKRFTTQSLDSGFSEKSLLLAISDKSWVARRRAGGICDDCGGFEVMRFLVVIGLLILPALAVVQAGWNL